MSEAHPRFQEWLNAGAEGVPARDLAVHASVCAGCQQSIAALDQLATIDPGRAAMPARAPVSERGDTVRTGRLASAAAGVMFSAVVLGLGASQLISVSRGSGSAEQPSQTPSQSVLGSTSTHRPSAGESSASPGESLLPQSTPGATPPPGGGATPRPRSSEKSTAKPTAHPIATGAPTATPSDTPTQTESPSAAPSDSQSAAPS